MTNTEFLPLCDVLFHIISMAAYFCDVVFDTVFLYVLYDRGDSLFIVVLLLIVVSLLVSQIVSLRWFMWRERKQAALSTAAQETAPPATDGTNAVADKFQPNVVCCGGPTKTVSQYVVTALHCCQLGILWRYAKLFVPVDLRNVKNEVRDLCMLRLVHAFCESAPMLLLQLHVLASIHLEEYYQGHSPELRLKTLNPSYGLPQQIPTAQTVLMQKNDTFKELNTISAALSLFNVCWSLASFSKNVRLQNVHRLVLTWLGVIFQFLWRLGTIISRVTALTVYASLYHHWVLLVIILHWVSMLLWLISPKNVFHGERISQLRKIIFSAMIAFVYVFAYINLTDHRQKMLTFYVVMFLENALLVCLWLVGIWSDRPDRWHMVPITVFTSFLIGIIFMAIYYRYFHIRRLGYESGGRPPEDSSDLQRKCCSQAASKQCKCKRRGISNDAGPCTCIGNYLSGCNGECNGSKAVVAVPGVFNCRFTNPVNGNGIGATKRKKKKPTSFVPPPNLRMPSSAAVINSNHVPTQLMADTVTTQSTIQNLVDQIVVGGNSAGPMAVPFWKQRPPMCVTAPSQNGSSENESSSVGSRVNIQQKLQEKKQKQLAELKVIEEEIKQGKLGPNLMGTLGGGSYDEPVTLAATTPSTSAVVGQPLPPRQPIPRIKKHSEFDPHTFWNQHQLNEDNGGYSNMMMLLMQQQCHRLQDSGREQEVLVSAGTNNLNMPNNSNNNSNNNNNNNNENNSLTRGAMTKSKVPRIFHQNIQTSTAGSGVSSNSCQEQQQQQQQQPASMMANYYHHEDLMHGPYPYKVPPPKSKLGTPAVPQQSHRGTPEVLLAPHHYLETERNGNDMVGGGYYDWGVDAAVNNSSRQLAGQRHPAAMSSEDDEDNTMYHPHMDNKIPSDIDSQMSLPRSYTLPREFKYYRRNKSRKMDNFVASNNSSDGDVDSVDDNESHHNSSNNLRANLNGAQPNKTYYDNLMSRRHQQQQQQHHLPQHRRMMMMMGGSGVGGGSGVTSNFDGHHFVVGGGGNVSGRVSVPAVATHHHPIYLNAPVIAATSNGRMAQRQPNFVPNLDLISNVMDSVANASTSPMAHAAGHHRHQVMRMNGSAFLGAQSRHETKL